MSKPKKYKNLTSLIENDTKAQEYYDTLPPYIKEQISQRDHNVNSYASLRDYAENLLRGDD